MSNKGFTSVAIVLITAILVIGGVTGYTLIRNRQFNPREITTTTTLPSNDNVSKVPPSSSVIDANNRFALDLFSRYNSTKPQDENIFFSPFSISSAIAMTYEGAKGKTAAEIENVFHFPTDIHKLRESYESIYKDINSPKKPYKLSTANALWVQRGYKLFDNYVNTVKTYYDGGITNLNFGRPPEAVGIINRWVEDKTNDRIKNLLSKDDVSSLTRLVLTNAIYFKGEWVSKFNKELTKEENFTMSNGIKHKVSMMQQTSHFKHAELSNVSILQLPYKGNDVSMIVILPKKNNLPSIEKTISYQQLNEWESKMKNHKVEVHLPKFQIETKEYMAGDLQAMGMPTAFSPSRADFSGIAPIRIPADNLYIGDVIHQTFIENKEDGTEAAAATAVVIKATGMAPNPSEKLYIFNANHPFIFLIQQNQTGNILFMGRVVNP